MPTFSYAGAQQTYVVPAGITELQVECWGAQGGDDPAGAGAGGLGGYSKGVIAVTPGETLYINVGGKGVGSTSSVQVTGGWNGGGYAWGYTSGAYASGGGGASDVRAGGTALANRKIVAGGGGGSGSYSNVLYAGGAGGGANGLAAAGTYSSYTAAGGGTQSAGGAQGTSSSYSQAGSLGQGGNQTATSGNWNGCGGGGGYYGGGSGAAVGSGGGGGSGYVGGVTSGTMTSGIRSGDGQVVITLLDSPPTASITNLTDGQKFDPRLPLHMEWGYADAEDSLQQRYEIGIAEAGGEPEVFSNTATGRSGSFQYFVVPSTGTYVITGKGAKGGDTDLHVGGKGASVTGEFQLTAGHSLKILVAQAGSGGNYAGAGAGGGGGTFVYNETTGTLLLAAGGGGGAGDAYNGADGSATQSATPGIDANNGNYVAAPTPGNSGNDYTTADPGAGWNNATGPYGQQTFLQGGLGGVYQAVVEGGFGGGGAGGYTSGDSGGGGGGYTGGNAGYTDAGGGGGGSYNAGANPSATAGANNGHGQVVIEPSFVTTEYVSGNHYHDFAANEFTDESDYQVQLRVHDGTSWSDPVVIDLRADSWTYGAETPSALQEGNLPLDLEAGTYEVQVRTADAVDFGPWSESVQGRVLQTSNARVFTNGAWMTVPRWLRHNGAWIAMNPKRQ